MFSLFLFFLLYHYLLTYSLFPIRLIIRSFFVWLLLFLFIELVVQFYTFLYIFIWILHNFWETLLSVSILYLLILGNLFIVYIPFVYVWKNAPLKLLIYNPLYRYCWENIEATGPGPGPTLTLNRGQGKNGRVSYILFHYTFFITLFIGIVERFVPFFPRFWEILHLSRNE